MLPAIWEGYRIKSYIVSKDEKEKGLEILNFGHTFGHALESLTNILKKLTHGESIFLDVFCYQIFNFLDFVKNKFLMII